jgi:hypothetical protein
VAGHRQLMFNGPVRVSGTASWRFAEDDAQPLHLLLGIRDSAGIALADDPIAPPRLARPPAPTDEPPTGADRDAAAAQWASWWTRFARQSAEHQLEHGPAGDAHTWLRARADAMQALFDPPDFTALSDAPQLRAAAIASFPTVQDWWRYQRRPAGATAFGWEAVREVAEQVGHDHGVAPDALDAAALVLDVEGPWWQVVTLGVVAVSRAACSDEDLARQVLRTAFVSGLAR